MGKELQPLLDFAVDVAIQAGRVTLRHYQAGVAVERKADTSPVTIADREAEQLIRRLITESYPTHGIIGEEFGANSRGSSHTWYVDPIDGTQSFIHGVPFYGVLMGLEIDGEMAIGVAHFPALNETVAAARGLGCRWNDRVARVTATSTLAEACMAYTDAAQVQARLGERWIELQRSTALQRGWGDCYGHCLVATGRADVMLDPRMNPWDCAALVPILIEAGGTFTDWTGRTTIHGKDAVSTNGRLLAETLAALGARRLEA